MIKQKAMIWGLSEHKPTVSLKISLFCHLLTFQGESTQTVFLRNHWNVFVFFKVSTSSRPIVDSLATQK